MNKSPATMKALGLIPQTDEETTEALVIKKQGYKYIFDVLRLNPPKNTVIHDPVTGKTTRLINVKDLSTITKFTFTDGLKTIEESPF